MTSITEVSALARGCVAVFPSLPAGLRQKVAAPVAPSVDASYLHISCSIKPVITMSYTDVIEYSGKQTKALLLELSSQHVRTRKLQER